VFTVEEAKALRGDLPGHHIKNLFLRNKKEEMWLVVALEDRAIDLKRLGEVLGAGRLSFGSAERLKRHLGVEPGSVTPLALINDESRSVQLVLDRGLVDGHGAPVNVHPLVNTMTTAMAAADLLRFFEVTGHVPRWLDFPI
jgi:Ala-tRNA(Pro) deacylase